MKEAEFLSRTLSGGESESHALEGKCSRLLLVNFMFENALDSKDIKFLSCDLESI